MSIDRDAYRALAADHQAMDHEETAAAITALLDALEQAEGELDEAHGRVRLLDAANDEEQNAADAANARAEQAEAGRELLSIALHLAETGEEVQTSERYSNAVALAQAVSRADRAEAERDGLYSRWSALTAQSTDHLMRADQAEARLQAVRDVLTEWEHVKHTKRILRDLRDALDGTQ